MFWNYSSHGALKDVTSEYNVALVSGAQVVVTGCSPLLTVF